MKYTIYDKNMREVSFLQGMDNAVILDTDDMEYVFTIEQFKDFRKAVGYVWQEVHSGGDVHSN